MGKTQSTETISKELNNAPYNHPDLHQTDPIGYKTFLFDQEDFIKSHKLKINQIQITSLKIYYCSNPSGEQVISGIQTNWKVHNSDRKLESPVHLSRKGSHSYKEFKLEDNETLINYAIAVVENNIFNLQFKTSKERILKVSEFSKKEVTWIPMGDKEQIVGFKGTLGPYLSSLNVYICNENKCSHMGDLHGIWNEECLIRDIDEEFKLMNKLPTAIYLNQSRSLSVTPSFGNIIFEYYDYDTCKRVLYDPDPENPNFLKTNEEEEKEEIELAQDSNVILNDLHVDNMDLQDQLDPDILDDDLYQMNLSNPHIDNIYETSVADIGEQARITNLSQSNKINSVKVYSGAKIKCIEIQSENSELKSCGEKQGKESHEIDLNGNVIVGAKLSFASYEPIEIAFYTITSQTYYYIPKKPYILIREKLRRDNQAALKKIKNKHPNEYNLWLNLVSVNNNHFRHILSFVYKR